LLFAVAFAAWHRSSWLDTVASATATLLVVDAWFDTLTASTGTELGIALAMALLVELPLAALCVLVARRAAAAAHGR